MRGRAAPGRIGPLVNLIKYAFGMAIVVLSARKRHGVSGAVAPHLGSSRPTLCSAGRGTCSSTGDSPRSSNRPSTARQFRNLAAGGAGSPDAPTGSKGLVCTTAAGPRKGARGG